MTAAIKGDVQLLDGIETSEPGNALRLTIIARGQIHYVDTWNTWIVYRDGKWELDGGGVGLQAFAKLVPPSIFTIADTIRPPEGLIRKDKGDRTNEENAEVAWYNAHIQWARKSNTDATLKHMVNLARDLPGMRITSEELDAKPHLFNLQNGTYNFTSGEFQRHDPGDLLTKKANAWYDPSAAAPRWVSYLEQWQPDHGVQKFLQSITGSGLIGVPVQNLFVNVGAGRNGKGTFYKQIQLILGDYAGTAPEDMLVETKYKVHDEEKARLRGCRFLLAPETSIGDRLDESGIKNMTGGDMIHARHLYGRPFDFMPTHTAFLHTNYEPHIRGTDPGIWNRVIKIPWNTYIKEDQRDMLIDQKLETERSGILNWLIAGCRDWLTHGLRKPPAITQATEGYRADQDMIGRFIDESMGAMLSDANGLGQVDYLAASLLRKHYESWCQQEGTKPWVTASVGKELRSKGWEPFLKRIGQVVIRAWHYPSAVTHTSSDQPLLTTYTSVTPFSSLNQKQIEKEEEKSVKEVKYKNGVTGRYDVTDDWEPSEAQIEQAHREWLYDRGYPVPPTDEEISAYLALQEEEYDDQEGRFDP